jgi:hypothetical protein
MRSVSAVPAHIAGRFREPTGFQQAASGLWIAFVVPYTYVYDRDGDKTRTVQFRAAGIISPSSLFFVMSARLLITPGLYEFKAGETGGAGEAGRVFPPVLPLPPE